MVFVLQVVHGAWEGFNATQMRAEFAEHEAEKQRYLAAKAAASAGAGVAASVAAPAAAGVTAHATVTTRSGAKSKARA